MLSALLTALLLPLGACGGGGGGLIEAAPASALAVSSIGSPEFGGVSDAVANTPVQSATAVQLSTDAVVRLDAALAALGGGARWAGQVVEGLTGEGWMEFVLHAPSDDDYALHIHYANASVASAAVLVRVNDGLSQSILLPPTAPVPSFAEAPALVVNLLAGRNSLRLQAAPTEMNEAGLPQSSRAVAAVTVQRLPALASTAFAPTPEPAPVAVPSPFVSSALGGSGEGAGHALLANMSGSAPSVDAVAMVDASVPAAAGVPAPPMPETTAVTPVVAPVETVVALAQSSAGTTPALPASGQPVVTPWATPRPSARIFISGHSLTDNPLGDHIVSIANSLGGSSAARYNQQIVIGSPIRFRTDRNANWAGYSRGKNRDGTGMNVINELRSPTTLGGDRYDTLLIAENHNSLQMLQWEDTVRNLRHFHERFIAGNASGRSLFYETWIDINDKSNPAAWIAHERAQSKAWQCVATRVNTALAAEGRSDRITPMPAGAALVDLVERATQGRVPGITQGTTVATINTLLSDNVHLTRTGVYYLALVSYSAIYQRSPVGAAVPSGVSSEAAASLQEAAWRFVSDFYGQYQEPSLEACRTELAQNFCPTYWNYRGQAGNIAGCRRTFGTSGADNPLDFNAATNASYWFPAP